MLSSVTPSKSLKTGTLAKNASLDISFMGLSLSQSRVTAATAICVSGNRLTLHRYGSTADIFYDGRDKMSRLDSFIRRLTAQRDILNAIIDLVEEVEGSVLEFGH